MEIHFQGFLSKEYPVTTETILENHKSSALEPSDSTQAYFKETPVIAGIFRAFSFHQMV